MRSVVLVGQVHPGGLTDSIAVAFESNGWKVRRIAWGPWTPTVLSQLAFRHPAAAAWFRRDWRTAVGRLSPGADLGLVVKGPFLDARCIDVLRRRIDAPVVCWNPDDPLDAALSNRGGGMPAAVPAYDAYVTWSEDVADRLGSLRRDVLVVPFGWDPTLHSPIESTNPKHDRPVFIGSWTAEREQALRKLAHLEPIVYGNQWPASVGLDVRGEVVGDEFRRTVADARWHLNLLRPQNARSHNMRTFELPACGGFQIAPRTPDHVRFLPQADALLFDEVAEIELPPPPDDARDRGWLDAHTYHRRVSQLLADLGLGR